MAHEESGSIEPKPAPPAPPATPATPAEDDSQKINNDNDPTISFENLSDLTIDRIVDVIDFEVEHILWEPSSRKAHFDSLEFFWNLFPGRQVEKGRRYTRYLMAHILTYTCASHPYGPDSEEDDEEEAPVEEMESLVKWNEDQWSGLRQSFSFLRSLLLREDAQLNYLSESDVTQEAANVDEEVANSALFKKKYTLLLDLITIHETLAPIRVGLEAQINKVGGRKSISKRKLEQVWENIQKLEGSAPGEAILSLFNIDKDDYKGKDLPHLKSLSAIREVLQKPPFELCFFQESVENIMHRFNKIVSGHQDCALIEARYAIPKDSTLFNTLSKNLDHRVALFSARRRKGTAVMEKEDLRALRRGREALNAGHGDDPIDAAVEAARAAAGGENHDANGTSSPDPNRNSGPRLTIIDNIEEDEESEAAERAKLSRVPKRRRRSRAPPSSPEAHIAPPDDGIFDEDGKVRKRLRWTDEEKMCVKEGVKNHGIGKWKQIKIDYDRILRNRTPVQIKDCWRTMTKNNEV